MRNVSIMFVGLLTLLTVSTALAEEKIIDISWEAPPGYSIEKISHYRLCYVVDEALLSAQDPECIDVSNDLPEPAVPETKIDFNMSHYFHGYISN